ncbi:endoplasmic reticulum metallopeptidase 1 [Trichonephila clavipes]|nr:endoplasmic reticulum metallopeptidase 1 [Trichonephila clavipes]
MKKVDEQTKMNLVFFDFMGLFMVVYRVSVATAINALVVVLSLVDMLLKSKRSGMPLRKRILLIGKTFIFLIMSLIGAYVFCASIAVVLDIFNATMSWYRSPYLVAGLYGCSSLAALIFIHSLTTSKDETLREKWVKEDIYFDAARLLWISCLIVLELAKINSSFICCAWALFPLLIRGVLGNFFNLVGPKGSQASHLTIHIFMQLIPLSLLLYCGWSMYTVFIPIMGRIGAMINPDLLVGLFTTVLVFFSTSYMFSLIQVLASPRKVIMLLLFIVATTVTLVCVTPLGFPYSGDEQSPAPMRLYILKIISTGGQTAVEMEPSIERLNSNNYNTWKEGVRVLLMDRNSWMIITGQEDKLDDSTSAKEKRNFESRWDRAYSTIYLSIENEYWNLISDTCDSIVAWKKLQDQFQPQTRARVNGLLDEFFNCRILEEEEIGLYAARL